MTTDRPAGSPPDDGPALHVSLDLATGRVRVTGELDRVGAHHLLDALAALEPSDHPVWTVAAGGISFCDAEGLRVLARGQALAAGRGRRLRMTDVPPFLDSVVRMCGLAGLVEPGPPRAPAGAASPAPAPPARGAGARAAARRRLRRPHGRLT